MNGLQAFKDKLNTEKGVLGMFMKTGDPAFVEMAGYAGMDFAILDCEHGPQDPLGLQNLIRAAQIAGIAPIVRTQGVNPEEIARYLDVGAFGVQVPQVDSAEQVRTIVKAAKFSPDGDRGICIFVRANKYSSQDRYDYFKNANETMVIVQLEGKKAIDNLDEILDVPGMDMVFIGPYDLSSSLGLIGQVTHPDVVAAMQVIVQKAAAKGVTVGAYVDTVERAKFWQEKGIRYFALLTDSGIFTRAVKGLVEDYRND